jgi:phospholipase C
MLKCVFSCSLSTLLLIGCNASSAGPTGDAGAPDAVLPDGASSDGGLCSQGTALCGATCTATATDPNNCGHCGTVCAKGQSCSGGACGLVCNGTTIKCGGECVDVRNDGKNCGRCGNACSSGQVCSASKCGASCTGGTSDCGGSCVDEKSDPNNCGACAAVCAAGQVCTPGGCASTCPPNTKACFQSCVDTSSDPTNCGDCGIHCEGAQVCTGGACLASNIQHVVLIVEENHTFDAYFGNYCTAASGSNPTCTSGPGCCEAAPLTEPGGASPEVLDDSATDDSGNESHDRNHAQACELDQLDNGAMDHYVTGCTYQGGVSDPACCQPRNWVLADQSTVGMYWDYAGAGALADRYFQPIAGSTSSNDMYFAVSHYQFIDNTYYPNTKGAGCVGLGGSPIEWSGRTTIGDLFQANGVSFTVYADGYDVSVAAAPSCPSVLDYPSDCPWDVPYKSPCNYDPSDIPFQYYSQFADNPEIIKDYSQLANDIATNSLPSLVYVKARTYRNEHPGWSTIARGTSFVSGVVDAVESSSYKDNTLILLTWDEGGGFFDHVPPPPSVDTAYDQDDSGQPVPYGTRVPALAIGKFALVGAVSHVQMEHSSIVRFLEYNFLGQFWVGGLGGRDAVVNGIGSLLDPSTTGIAIP